MTNPNPERAARALCIAMGDDPDREGPGNIPLPYYEGVRAVLMAVREPDVAMVKAAEDREDEIVGTYGCADPTGGFETDGPKICFTAMIDAILSEQND